MKKQLLLYVFIILPLVASADVVEIDGIYYDLISKLKIAKVTKMPDYQHYYGSIVIPSTVVYKEDVYNVTSIDDYAFNGCTGLTSITIPNSVTSIGDFAFSGCGGLASITIPNSVTSIGDNAFGGCTGLTSITIPNSVTSIGDYAFGGCTGLTSITIPNSVTSIGNFAFQNCTGLASITIPNSVTSIGNFAFQFCTGLTSITIPNSVTSIGYNAFEYCTGLTSITIPNSVTSIGDSPFSSCSGLTSIVVESNNPIYDSRENCNAIIETASNTLVAGCENTTIPNSVTSIGHYAFSSCSGLASITIPNSVTSIGNFAFGGCTGLTSITIPNSLTSIGDYAFNGCSGLTSIVVESNNPIYDSRENCNAIIETASNTLVAGCENTTIPNSVTSIGHYAFSARKGLTSIIIPNSVASIGWCVFQDCSNLKNVIIGTGIKIIENYSFANCKGLLNVYCYSENVPQIVPNAFEDSEQEYITLHVPATSVDAYKITEPWCYFLKVIAISNDDPKPSGIKVVTTDINKDIIYGLNGQQLYTPQKGMNIVKMSDGSVMKIIKK